MMMMNMRLMNMSDEVDEEKDHQINDDDGGGDLIGGEMFLIMRTRKKTTK